MMETEKGVVPEEMLIAGDQYDPEDLAVRRELLEREEVDCLEDIDDEIFDKKCSNFLESILDEISEIDEI